MASREEQRESPAHPVRLLDVDEAHRAHAWVARDGVAGDHPAAVVSDHRDVLQLEEVDDAPDALDVLVHRQCRVGGESTGATAREVDQVAGDVVGQVREERAERRAADRPAVDEQHVGSAPDPTVGDFAGTDVEEPVRVATEQLGGVGRGEH